MSLQQTIESALKDAMRSGDDTRKISIRAIIAGIKLARVEKMAELTDEDVQAIIRKEIKAQRESILDAQKADRADLIADAEAQIKILEEFTPKQLSREEVTAQARAVIAEVGATSPTDMGKVMKVLQPKIKDIADGRMISEVVKELLAAH